MSYGTVLIVIEVTGRVYLHSRGTNLKDCCRLDREACCELPWPALPCQRRRGWRCLLFDSRRSLGRNHMKLRYRSSPKKLSCRTAASGSGSIRQTAVDTRTQLREC